jgi:hypothetical protein
MTISEPVEHRQPDERALFQGAFLFASQVQDGPYFQVLLDKS